MQCYAKVGIGAGRIVIVHIIIYKICLSSPYKFKLVPTQVIIQACQIFRICYASLNKYNERATFLSFLD